MAALKPIGLLFRGREFRKGLKELESLWTDVPEPKIATPNAYLIVEYGAAFALEGGDLDQAETWATRAPMFAPIRHDMGEAEFLIGKVAFARGEMERVKEQFAIANVKSEGRCFEGQDDRYKQLVA